jgi:hypothetical protein
MKRLLCLILAAAPAWGAACPSGYGYYKTLTVQAGKASGTQSSFPVLVLNPASASGTLRTTGNGGHVTSSSGYDIVPSTTSGALLPFELVSGSYVAASGNLQMWVNVSSLADGTVINLCYGNSAVTTYQGTNSTTWNGYVTVAHSDDNQASTTVLDSSPAANNGTAVANTGTKTATGKIGAALAYNGSSDYVSFGSPSGNPYAADSTFSWQAWVKPNAIGGAEKDLMTWFGSLTGIVLGASSGPKWFLYRNGGGYGTQDSSSTPATGTWYQVVATYDGANERIYVNGSKESTGAGSIGNLNGSFASNRLTVGGAYVGSYVNLINATIDEVRSTATALSDSWIATEYSNQNSPGNDGGAGFWAVGAETSAGGGGGGGTFTISPATIPSGHSGNIALILTGTGTSWVNGSTVITASGVAGSSCGAATVTSSTAATVVCSTGSSTGTLTLTESATGSAAAAASVALPSLGINLSRGNLSSIQTLVLTGINTLWTQESPAGLLSVSGGTGASIGTPTITSNTGGTVALTVGTATGTLIITDTSTGKTATFSAGGSGSGSGCAVVSVQ